MNPVTWGNFTNLFLLVYYDFFKAKNMVIHDARMLRVVVHEKSQKSEEPQQHHNDK